MKRFTYAMVMAVALIVMVSSFAMAGPDCKSKTTAEKVSMGECCIKAAKAGEGCCGKDADAVKAAYASYTAGCSAAEQAACAASAEKAACADKAAYKAASADMHECCATAVAAGKGCCGKDSDALKASYEEKVAYHKAAATVTADMGKCCAAAMAESKGCCGHSADEMKADFDKKVEKESQKVATSTKETSEG
jgi:hypothetical protein